MRLVRRVASSVIPLLWVLVCSFAPAAAQTRVWTKSDGSSFEAEFVRFKRSDSFGSAYVEFKPAQGEAIFKEARNFAKADREYLAAKRLESAGGTATGELRMQPELSWTEYHIFGDREATIRCLQVVLTATGREAAAASCLTNFKIEACETDSPQPLRLREQWQLSFTNEELLLRYGDFGQPTTGFDFDFQLEVPAGLPQTIKRLSGSFDLITGERHEIIIPRFPSKQDVLLDDETLFAIDLDVKLNPSDNPSGLIMRKTDGGDFPKPTTLRVEVAGSKSRLYAIELLDAQGEIYYDFSGSATNHSSHFTRSFTFHKPVPPDLQLRLVVFKTKRKQRIPFEYVNLKTPEPLKEWKVAEAKPATATKPRRRSGGS